MGQYFVLASVERKEYVNCYAMGHGAKALEQSYGPAGMGQVLLLLLGTGMGRGGGDFHDPRESALPSMGSPGTPEWETHWSAHKKLFEDKAVLGRWAGTHVVFVGDYAEDDDCPQIVKYAQIYSDARAGENGWTEISDLVKPYMTANFGFDYRESEFAGHFRIVDLEESS